MKNFYVIMVLLFANTGVIWSQVTPNSNKFSVENYAAIDSKGKYALYNTHGFYENVAKGTVAKVFILPILKFDINNIKYIDNKGNETSKSSDQIRTLIIPVTQELALPNESQKASICAAIRSTTIAAFYAPILKNTNGQPVLTPYLITNPGLTNHFFSLAKQYETTMLAPQEQLINDYNTNFQSQIISPTEVEFIVEAGGEVVYSKRISGTLVGNKSFKNISIENPTEYVKNLLANGNGDISVSYKFKNSKNSYINAHIDGSTVVNQFLSDAQKSSVSQRSSGWAFLGLGSSRKSMKSSFNQQVDSQYDAEKINNTRIEMYDADDDMIYQFEEKFFPDISREEAIKNHFQAAEKAKAEGNEKLQNLHLQFAESLQKNDPNLTPNIEAAVAALGRKDYIGFIANGVRWGNNGARGNTTFKRVLNSTEMTKTVEDYSHTKTISVQHAVTQPVIAKEDVKFRASVGVIDVIPWDVQLNIFNGYNTVFQNVKGVLIGPTTLGGALHLNNILPGTLVKKVGSYSVYDAQTFTDALKNYEPGERTDLTLVVPNAMNPNIYQEKTVQFTLGSFPVID
ncbi:hypothetical protein KYG33_05960 [Chryseobacterium sp. D764]|uniref:hypothetical protein n=1 Tax=Chryseobacterium sp. D764 TaxID=2856522 RepID=UPI001C59A895|nr:hypothetical protein [Chryseobacterium sp. D764]QXU50583.1 hypothetical protein KYG33_05960 [Chryseobacterium sp. D764]